MPPPTPTQASTDGAFDYDVFISYSHADREWVDGTLLPMLEGTGLGVCIDHGGVRIGAPSVKEMERAVVTRARRCWC